MAVQPSKPFTAEFDAFPPHLQLLLLAAQPRLAPALQIRLQALAGGSMDWNAFLTLAFHHRLAPAVFQSLEALLPAQVREPLHQASTYNAFAALRAAGEFRRITQAFAAQGLHLVALKGIALSQMLYASPNARHVGDLDLLTTTASLLRQIELLGSLDYKIREPEARLTPRRLRTYTRLWKDLTFENSTTAFELDLHWRLFNNPAHPANCLARQPALQSITLFDTTLQTFTLRDQFLYTTAHGVGEAFTYLKALADVAAFLSVLNQAQLDEALRHASTIGLLPQVSAAIHLANAWMLTDATSSHLLPASHAIARTLHRRTLHLLLRQRLLPERSHPSPANWLRFELQLTPGLRSIAHAAGRFLFRPRVWAAVDLPDWLFPLYPILGLLLPPRRHKGQSHAAPRTPLESPNLAGTTAVAKSPPNT